MPLHTSRMSHSFLIILYLEEKALRTLYVGRKSSVRPMQVLVLLSSFHNPNLFIVIYQIQLPQLSSSQLLEPVSLVGSSTSFSSYAPDLCTSTHEIPITFEEITNFIWHIVRTFLALQVPPCLR